MKPAPKKTSSLGLGALPTLNTRGGLGFKKLPKLEDLEKRKKELNEKLQQQKQLDTEAMEKRKQIIMEQREKMMAKKKKEREEALLNYEKAEASNKKTLDEREKKKRSDIYAMLRR